MAVFVGTSGWQYRHWRARFYPPGVAQARWLEHYAARFQTVEVNNAFYRLPEMRTFEDWRARTPNDFVMAVKASRYLTHVRRLRAPTDAVTLLIDRARHLGPKLGPVLLQLPANFRVDPVALDETLAAFPSGVRVAFEPRHDSWHRDEVADILARRGAAFCLSDTPERRAPRWRTADWGYVRFHHGRARPPPCYGRSALRSWAERLAELFGSNADIFTFFNNDGCACALRDARLFALALSRAGMSATRVPGASEVRVCGQGE
jgi:uncharacterized protein YecE (DUF72 family)